MPALDDTHAPGGGDAAARRGRLPRDADRAGAQSRRPRRVSRRRRGQSRGARGRARGADAGRPASRRSSSPPGASSSGSWTAPPRASYRTRCSDSNITTAPPGIRRRSLSAPRLNVSRMPASDRHVGACAGRRASEIDPQLSRRDLQRGTRRVRRTNSCRSPGPRRGRPGCDSAMGPRGRC